MGRKTESGTLDCLWNWVCGIDCTDYRVKGVVKMGQLKLKDLYIGKTDGYNEFLEYGSDVFRNLFFVYPNLDICKLLDGSVYYICGDKGTG